MAYESDKPGPYETASLNKPYRAVKLQSNATPVDLVVTSGSNAGINLHLAAGELHTGPTIITGGTVTGVIGYLL